MKQFVKTLFLFLISICTYAQSSQTNPSLKFENFLSGVKYAYVMFPDKDVQYVMDNPNGSNAKGVAGILEYVKELGFESVKWGKGKDMPQNFKSFCEYVIIEPSWSYEKGAFTDLQVKFESCNNDQFKFVTSRNIENSVNADIKESFRRAFMDMYAFKKSDIPSNILKMPNEMTEWTEKKLIDHFKEKGVDPIEGIYESTITTVLIPKYKLGLIKTDSGYNFIYLSGASNYLDWKEGELKSKLYASATSNLFKANWKMGIKAINKNTYVTFETGAMNVIIQDRDKILFVKMYPTANDNITTIKGGTASGTGFAVSSNGLIVTNHHVINGATSINVRGVNGDFSKSYKAKIIIEDKNNDLAIIKIDDSRFTSLGAIPFLINNKPSDVGTSIFVMGYPLRASMGDEIKLTNGIISSKSGFQDDVTSYQITAPIQPGNSGGPLFDGKGNLIGIVNSKHLGAENVSYAIKSLYLINLFDIMTSRPSLQTVSSVGGKSLAEQVKILKKYIYIIEVN